MNEEDNKTNMLVNSISLTGLEWKNIPEVIRRDRMRLKDYNYFSNRDANIKLDILKRIGSPSMSGEVYLLKCGDFKFVTKILPIISEKSVIENQNEIKIAIKASELVLTDQSEYFPIVYGSGICLETKWDKSSRFYQDNNNYFLKHHLSEKLPSHLRKQFLLATKTLNIKEEILDVYSNMSGNKGEEVDLEHKTLSHILMSELAWGDLGQLLSLGKINKELWNEIVSQILLGINDMQEKLGIVHNDLHQENILIYLIYEEGDFYINCLIHDFGKSTFVSSWDREKRTADVEKILEILENKCNIKSIRDRIKKLRDMVKRHTHNSPVLPSLIKEWNESVE